MRSTLTALVLLSLTIIAVAQNTPVAFEVASVKQSPPPPPGTKAALGLCHGIDTQVPALPPNFPFPPPAQGRCLIRALSLEAIISVAYSPPTATMGVEESITGGPGWVSSDPYDIDAKAEDVGSATDMQLKVMLRQLLTERFKLQFHNVQKEVKGYSLVVAKSGVKLKLGAGDFQGVFRYGGGKMSANNAPVAEFARALSTLLRAPVSDQTGLTGGYAFNVALPSDNDPAAPSLFTVLQEELGLRLEATNVPVDVIVIDHAEKPDAN